MGYLINSSATSLRLSYLIFPATLELCCLRQKSYDTLQQGRAFSLFSQWLRYILFTLFFQFTVRVNCTVYHFTFYNINALRFSLTYHFSHKLLSLVNADNQLTISRCLHFKYVDKNTSGRSYQKMGYYARHKCSNFSKTSYVTFASRVQTLLRKIVVSEI